jgi:hypothetical protein
MSRCPHCSEVIKRPPKRSRKCPHCQEPIELRLGQLMTPDSAEKFDAEKKAQEAIERFQEGRRIAVEAIKNAKNSQVVVGFKLYLSGYECDVCRTKKYRVFPVESCTPDMLPPYEDCEYENGCSGCLIEVLDSDNVPGLRLRKPTIVQQPTNVDSEGRRYLGAALVIALFVVIVCGTGLAIGLGLGR